MTTSQALRNAISCVLSNTGNVDCGHLPADDALETMECLYRLLIAAEMDEAKPISKTTPPVDGKTEPHLTLTGIARQLGICSRVTHIPYPSAVAAIIDHLKLEPCEYKKTKDGTLYSSSAMFKVEDWLIENDFPAEITTSNGEFAPHVIYTEKGDESTT